MEKIKQKKQKNNPLIREGFNGILTAHDFDEQKLPSCRLLKVNYTLSSLVLVRSPKTCIAGFTHSISTMKRKSRKRKQNTQKSTKQKKTRHLTRTIEILKKIIVADLSEGRTCEKEDLGKDIIKELEKREQKWVVA